MLQYEHDPSNKKNIVNRKKYSSFHEFLGSNGEHNPLTKTLKMKSKKHCSDARQRLCPKPGELSKFE